MSTGLDPSGTLPTEETPTPTPTPDPTETPTDPGPSETSSGVPPAETTPGNPAPTSAGEDPPVVTQTQVVTTDVLSTIRNTVVVGSTTQFVDETTEVSRTTTFLPGETQTIIHPGGGLSSSAKNGIIAGSVIGGLAALVLLAYLLWRHQKRRRRIRFSSDRPITFDDEKNQHVTAGAGEGAPAFFPAGLRPVFNRGASKASAHGQPTLPNIDGFVAGHDDEFSTTRSRHSLPMYSSNQSGRGTPIPLPPSSQTYSSPRSQTPMFFPPGSGSSHSVHGTGMRHSSSGGDNSDERSPTMGDLYPDDNGSIGSAEERPSGGLRVMNRNDSS
ncbi:hypothetical protein BT69DRAFT_1347999 [Atractiella rhizophila]|nr:hypothetical protein BT69DRAFT_1347999 [Atractiella rhizophila]